MSVMNYGYLWRYLWPAIVVLGIVTAVPTGSSASAALPRVSMRIDTSRVGEAGPTLQARLEEVGHRIFREAEVLPARDVAGLMLDLSVAERDGERPAFVVTLQLDAHGLHYAHDAVCALCTEGELLELVAVELEQFLTWLSAKPDVSGSVGASSEDGESDSEAVGQPEPETGSPPSSAPPPSLVTAPEQASKEASERPGSDGRRSPVAARAIVPIGWSLLGAGLAAVTTGSVLTGVGQGDHPDDARKYLDFKPPGVTLLVAGASGALTGAVMLIVRAASNKRRAVSPRRARRGTNQRF